MFTVRNIFFPVGQGGFMYSRIDYGNRKKFDFIYDCGSITKEFKIDDFLDKISKNIPLVDCVVDCLCISHFDIDHINGIKKLCNLVKFKKIIYPFHDDENYRLLNLVHEISKSGDAEIDNDILNIIYDPTENLRSITGESILIGVGPFNNISDINIEEEASTDTQEGRDKIKQKGYCVQLINNDWMLYNFHPALPNNKQDYEKITNNFKNQFIDIKDWIINGNLAKNNSQEKKQIKQFYRQNFSKTDPFNRSSLMLYSGIKSPTQQSKYSVTSTKIIFPKEEYPFLFDCLLSDCCSFRYWHKPKALENGTYALLLTGDAQLKGTNWHGYLKDLKQNVTTVNLPHHGSKKNIDNQTFLGFDNIKNFLTFAGNHTSHGHPNKESMQFAIDAQPKANIIHVNQHQGLFEMVTLENNI